MNIQERMLRDFHTLMGGSNETFAAILKEDRKCRVCNGTGFASSMPMCGRLCAECSGSGEKPR